MNIYSYKGYLRHRKSKPDKYKDWVKNNLPDDIEKISVAGRYCPSVLYNDAEFKTIISDAFCDLVNKKISKNTIQISPGNEFFYALQNCDPILTDDAKINIWAKLQDSLSNFYSYSKKGILDVVKNWPLPEDSVIQLIKKNYRSLNTDQINCFVNKVSDGWSNVEIVDILENILPIVADKLNKLDVRDQEQRNYFVGEVAKRPSLFKHINMDFTFTFEDLKELPPMRRFDLLKFFYDDLISATSYKYNKRTPYYFYYGNDTDDTPDDAQIINGLSQVFNTQVWRNNIHISQITDEQLQELLFSASLKSNEKVRTWVEGYREFVSQKEKIIKNMRRIINKL